MSLYDKCLNPNNSNSESLFQCFSMKRKEILASSVAYNTSNFKFVLSEFLSNMQDGLDINQKLQNFQFSTFKSNIETITSKFNYWDVVFPYNKLFSLKPQIVDTFESSLKFNEPIVVRPSEFLLQPIVAPIKPKESVLPTVKAFETNALEFEATQFLGNEKNKVSTDGYAENNKLYLKNLSNEMREKTKKLIAYANKQGYEIKITSGLRTLAEQQELIKKDERNGTNYAAKGKSLHLSGSAIDISVYKDGKKLYDEFTDIVDYAKKELGLRWGGNFVNSPYEPWHFDCA